jgi:hypothetical protein
MAESVTFNHSIRVRFPVGPPNNDNLRELAMSLIPRAGLFIKNAYHDPNHSFVLYDVHGYLAFSCLGHPLANDAGIVYLHRYMASLWIHRWLLTSEDAHHKDENKRNNDWRNFKVMSRSDHILHHRNKLVPKKSAYYKRCPSCKKLFIYIKNSQKYCSNKCAHEATKRQDITRSQLIKLLKENNLTQVGLLFSVSCNAIKNWCRRFNIFYT